MTRAPSERKMREIRAIADAAAEAVLVVEMAARERKARRLEAAVLKQGRRRN